MNKPGRGPDWIDDGEKFALIGLDVPLACDVSRDELAPGLTVLPNADFELPEHWREWLGSLRVEDVGTCTLFLLARMASESLGVLDAENQRLQAMVGDWFMGLMLVTKFATTNALFITTGSRTSGEVDVRQFGPIDPPVRAIVMDEGPISKGHLSQAASIARGLEGVRESPGASNWRLLRCLRLYQDTCRETDIPERIHQFTRCVEGLIVPKQGETLKQFKSRTELFVGPKHHDLMGELYSVRSDVEHLHENRLLEVFDRARRIELAKLEAVSEWMARSCLARIILDPVLIAHFGNVASLQRFWEKDGAERRAIWGDRVDPYFPLAGFNFDHVSDGELGSREP